MLSRRLVALGALVFVAGCALRPASKLASASPDPATAPVLPVVVLQTVRSGLALDASEAERVDELLDEAQDAARAIGRARSAFVEILAQFSTI